MADDIKDLLERGRTELKKGRWERTVDTLSKAVSMLDGATTNDDRTLLAEGLRLRAMARARMGEYVGAVADVMKGGCIPDIWVFLHL